MQFTQPTPEQLAAIGYKPVLGDVVRKTADHALYCDTALDDLPDDAPENIRGRRLEPRRAALLRMLGRLLGVSPRVADDNNGAHALGQTLSWAQVAYIARGSVDYGPCNFMTLIRGSFGLPARQPLPPTRQPLEIDR